MLFSRSLLWRNMFLISCGGAPFLYACMCTSSEGYAMLFADSPREPVRAQGNLATSAARRFMMDSPLFAALTENNSSRQGDHHPAFAEQQSSWESWINSSSQIVEMKLGDISLVLRDFKSSRLLDVRSLLTVWVFQLVVVGVMKGYYRGVICDVVGLVFTASWMNCRKTTMEPANYRCGTAMWFLTLVPTWAWLQFGSPGWAQETLHCKTIWVDVHICVELGTAMPCVPCLPGCIPAFASLPWSRTRQIFGSCYGICMPTM